MTNRKLDPDVRQFGDLINTQTPVHVRPGSLLHRVVARFADLKGEQENARVPGAVLMQAGLALAPAFSGTGFNERTRVFPDFSARLYFLEAEAPEPREG